MLKLLKSPLLLILTTIFTIIFYISLSKTQQKNEFVDQQIETISKENQELQKNNIVLEEKLSSINPEQIIRDEFLMKKEGEYVVKIPAPPTKTQEVKEKNDQSNLQLWFDLIF